MSVSGVNGVGANQYAYRNNNQKVTNTGNFSSKGIKEYRVTEL